MHRPKVQDRSRSSQASEVGSIPSPAPEITAKICIDSAAPFRKKLKRKGFSYAAPVSASGAAYAYQY